MTSYVLVAEADRQVGLGHLAEMRTLAEALEARGVHAHRIAVGIEAPAGDGVERVDSYGELEARLRQVDPSVVAWSVRTDRWKQAWPRLAPRAHHVWIADVADDYPAVDVLIVPTLKPKWRKPESKTRVEGGPEFFPLDTRGTREIADIADRPRDVLLTLGGADRTEASLRIAPSLRGARSTVVIGPAFRHAAELARIAAAAGLAVVSQPAGLRELLLEHRIVISAGGNTLFEAAAAGTPALVTWEDPHEEEQGRAFAEAGAARVIGRGADVDVSRIRSAVDALLRSEDLEAMSSAGLCLIDGRGSERIASIIMQVASGVAA